MKVGDALAELEHDYVGIARCKSCHGKALMGDQVAVWKQGPHHDAFTTLKSEESQAIALRDGIKGPAQEAPECLACHVTAFHVNPDRISRPLKASDGVQCESCHGPGRSYRKKSIMADTKKARANGLWDPSATSGICERCHNSLSPTYDPARFTLKDGTQAGFDYDQAASYITHPIPPDVKGRYIELDKARKKREKQARGQ